MLNATPRESRQFPARFSRLPGIADSPPQVGNQLVPMRAVPIDDLDSNAAQMELKLSVLEKSNRALLDEVVRLQSEVKHLSHLSDRSLSDERHGQQALETALRSATEVIGQLNGRVRRAEERLAEDRAVIGALSNQVKNAEMLALSGQQELGGRQAQQNNRLQELKSELDDALHAKQSLEKVAFQLAEEVKQTRLRCDAQATEFSGALSELKKRARNLEEETRIAMETKRKDAEVAQQAELVSSQMRSQVESRLNELRQFLMEIRSKHDDEMHTNRSLEQQFNQRAAELQAAIGEQSRRREEAVHALEVMQREKEHAAEVERSKLQSKLTDVAEDVTRKILQRDMKLREESQDKYGQLQQMIEAEQELRRREGRAMQDDINQQFLAERTKVKDDLKTLQDEYKAEKRRTHDVVHKLEDAVNLLEKHIEENKKQQDKLLSAEIKSRRAYEKNMEQQIGDANKRLSTAASTLNNNIDALWEKLQEQSEKVKRQLQETVDAKLAATTKQAQEMEARVTSMTVKVAAGQDRLEKKMELAREAQSAALAEHLSQFQEWQINADQSIRDQTAETQRLAEEVLLLVEKGKTLKTEIDGRFQKEALTRERDNEKLRLDIDKLMRDLLANQKQDQAAEIDTLQGSVRKLAESIQTVKTVLGMKIQSEQKLRESSMQNMQEQIDELQKAMEDK